jgi:hypothetical protein
VARYGAISVDPLSLPGIDKGAPPAADTAATSEHAKAE